MVHSGVYKIICIGNGKFYIGSSKNIEKRISRHFSQLFHNNHINPHLQNAYNLYGKNAFRYEIIELCRENQLIEKEQYWMDKTNCYSRDIGFNNCEKSDRPTGYKHTEQAKKKMREAKLGKKLDNSHVQKIIDSRKGYRHSEETKKKISKANSGINNGMYGKREEEDHKKLRMKNLFKKPKWNKGLTKENDDRIAKLAYWKNKIPPNAVKCELVNKETGEKILAESLKELSIKSGLSLVTIHRLKAEKCGKKIKQKFSINIL